MGVSWEGMVIEEVIRQLNALGAGFEYSYCRTSGGLEIDLVLEEDFGRVALEIKYASTVRVRDLRGLRKFISEHQARLGLIIHNNVTPRLYEENLIGLPFNWL
jgi:uncharacterized protein